MHDARAAADGLHAPAVPDFDPIPAWRGAHQMTIYAWGRPRRFPRLPPPVPRFFDVAADARVLAHTYWQPRRVTHPTLVALHGLEGSSAAHYMQGLADKAFARGFNVLLLNQRNCGGTEHLSAGLYHSGLTADPLAVLHELIAVDRLPSIAIVGYSLGGNLALKLAGELGRDAPPQLHAVCAVSPTIDLARCVDALERPTNRLYQWNFVRNLKARLRRKAAAFPGAFDVTLLRGLHTVREFDERYTAPYFGFADAADYYHRASALRVMDRIAVPTLILTAADDPFVPPAQFHDPAVAGNAALTVMITAGGGHCAFVSARRDGDDGYWAEAMAVGFASRHVVKPSAPPRQAAARP